MIRSACRRGLVLPALLAVTTLVTASACVDDGDEDTTADDSGMPDTDGAPTCKIADEAACNDHPACMWNDEVAFCVVDCTQLNDAQSCEEAVFCEWIDATCEHHVS